MKKVVLAAFAFVVCFFASSVSVFAVDCTIFPTTVKTGVPVTVTITTNLSDDYWRRFSHNGTQYAEDILAFQANMPQAFTMTQAQEGSYTITILDKNHGGLDRCDRGYTVSNTYVPPPPPGSADVLKNPPKGWLLGVDLKTNLAVPAPVADFLENSLVPFVISLLLFLVITLSLIFLIIGGIRYTTSGGNKEGTAKAKDTITYALIGLALGLGAFLIVKILFTFFGM